MIACDRPLVYRWLTNRLTWTSLGGGGGRVRWRCSRQRELANPVIRIWWLNVEKIFAYSATIISWIRSFCRGFFPFWQRLYFAICRKNLLVQLSVIFVHILLCPYWTRSWHLLRSEIKGKKTGLQARFSPSLSSCRLALVAPPPKQFETRTSEPARRLVSCSSGDSRYLCIH